MTEPAEAVTTAEALPDTASAASRDEAPAAAPARRIGAIMVSLAALALTYVFATIGAERQPDVTGAEQSGYVIGTVIFAVLIATALRWLWLRARGRGEPRRLLSPWIAVGASVIAAFAAFGSSQG